MSQQTLGEEFYDLLVELSHYRDIPKGIIKSLRSYPEYLEHQLIQIPKEQKQEYTKKIKKEQEKNTRLRTEIKGYKELKGLLNDREKELEEKKERIKTLQKKIEELVKKNTRLGVDIKKKPKKIIDRKTYRELVEAEAYILKQDSIITEFRNDRERLRKKVYTLQEHARRMDVLDGRISSILSQVQSDLETLRKHYDKRVGLAHSKIITLKKIQKDLETELAATRDQLKYSPIYQLDRFMCWLFNTHKDM